MKKSFPKVSKNVNDTKRIAELFLKDISKSKEKNATVVGMYGDLGTGKTTFVKSIAKIFKVKRKVSSPTFVIIKKYAIKSKKFTHLFHIDAYRLKNAKEIKILGWKDMISDPKHIIFVEWPEKIIKAMPKKHHRISILHTEGGDRIFNIKV